MKKELIKLLKDSGNFDLFNDVVYNKAKKLTEEAGKRNNNQLGILFESLEGAKEKYIHDLIVLNRTSILAT